MKKVAIVILNWNGSELLKKFLPSVIQHSSTEWAEVIVADNGSTDDSLVVIEQQFPSVSIIRLDKNHGFAEGYNLAIEQVDAEYTVLLNSDVEVTTGWLDPIISVLDSDPTIAAAQPKILAQRKKEYFEYAGAAGGFMDIYGYPFCRGRVLHIIEKDNGQYDTMIDILWATGACLFIRTSVYKSEGGLDANFFAHQEEIDLCWRLRSRGHRLVCIPQSVVYHVGAATLQVESPRKTFLNFRNNLLMLYKNLSEKELKHVMRARFWLDYLAATKFLLTGHPKNAMVVYKARKEFYNLRRSYLPIREEYMKKATVQVIPELMRKSLIVSFYLKGEKRYTDF